MTNRLKKALTEPIHLKGTGPNIVLFHGFTGSPYDLRPLAHYLHKKGFNVIVPLLKGHGTSPKELHHIKAESWLNQSRNQIKTLNPKFKTYVGGLSMGALLAILVHRHIGNIGGLILISPALKLTLSAELTISAAKLGLFNKNKNIPKLTGSSDINDPKERKLCPSYKTMPVFGLLQFDKIRNKAKAYLNKITCPTFAAFGNLDGAINISSSHEDIFFETKQKLVLKTYERSKHILSLDYDKEEMQKDIVCFIRSLQ